MALDILSATDKARVMAAANHLVALSDLSDVMLDLTGLAFCLEASDATVIDARCALRALLSAIESEYEKRGL